MPLFDFTVDVTTTPTLFEITNSPRFFKRVLLHDSINSFPGCELIIPENANIYYEKYFIPEGLDVSVTFGNTDLGFLNPSLSTINNSIPKSVRETYISGDIFQVLESKFIADDINFKSTSFKDEISNIIQTNLTNYSYLVPRITTTSNIDYWYQSNQSDWEFFKSLREQAYTPQYEYSPFLMFINLKNEFIFKPIQELMEQPSIGTFTLNTGENSMFDRSNILNYSPVNQGLLVNKRKNNITIQSDESNTSIKEEEIKIENFLYSPSSNRSKFAPIFQSKQNISNSVYNFGLNIEGNVNNSKGFRNYQMIESTFPMQLDVTIYYNKDAVSGNVFTTSVSTLDPNIASKTYSDDWLIIESNHYYDPDGVAYSNLVLGRNTMDLPLDHPLYSQFIKKI